MRTFPTTLNICHRYGGRNSKRKPRANVLRHSLPYPIKPEVVIELFLDKVQSFFQEVLGKMKETPREIGISTATWYRYNKQVHFADLPLRVLKKMLETEGPCQKQASDFVSDVEQLIPRLTTEDLNKITYSNDLSRAKLYRLKGKNGSATLRLRDMIIIYKAVYSKK